MQRMVEKVFFALIRFEINGDELCEEIDEKSCRNGEIPRRMPGLERSHHHSGRNNPQSPPGTLRPGRGRNWPPEQTKGCCPFFPPPGKAVPPHLRPACTTSRRCTRNRYSFVHTIFPQPAKRKPFY